MSSSPIQNGNNNNHHYFKSSAFRKFYTWLNPPIFDDGSSSHYQLINPLPWIQPTVQLAVVAGLGNVLMGYNLSVLNTAMPIITADFGWCGERDVPNGSLSPFDERIDWNLLECSEAKSTQGIISSSLIFGAACGSFLSSALMARIGRRLSLLTVFMGFAIGGIIASFSQGFIMLLVARFMTGVFSGLATVIPAVYLQEMAPTDQRGFYGLIPTICTNLGVLLGICTGFPLKLPSPGIPLDANEWNRNRMWWRQMLAMPVVFSLFAALSLLKVYTFDTPEAIRLSGKSPASVEAFLWPTFSSPTPTTRAASPSPARGTIPLMKALSLPALRWRLLGGWILSACQQFSGMAVFVALSNALFAQAGVPSEYLTLASAAMALLQFVCSSIALQQLDFWPRKLLIGGGACLMGLSLVPAIIAGFGSNETIKRLTSILSTLAFASIYGMTYGPGLLIYLTELYPSEIKDVGLSVAFALNWSASFVVIYVASILTQLQCFILFTGVCLSTAFFVLVSYPETHVVHSRSSETNSTSTSNIEFSVLVNSSNVDTIEPTDTDHSQ